MTQRANAIEIKGLERRFGKTEAVAGLNLSVKAGRCYGLFGRNGAGKSTTIKCLLGHLRPTSGSVQVFGLSPLEHEVEVKRSIGYVPEQVAFYPWMTARGVLDFTASFWPRWNRDLEGELLKRFDLDATKKVKAMSKGMRAQLSLICAITPEPDLLLLDEPTSGLDPIVRREFIETVIGAYQEGDPHRRTVFVSTHLIQEFEGLIEEFTVIEEGKEVLTSAADAARARFKKVRLRFADEPPEIEKDHWIQIKRDGRDVELTTGDFTDEIEQRLRALSPDSIHIESLTLEEIFVIVGRRDLREA